MGSEFTQAKTHLLIEKPPLFAKDTTYLGVIIFLGRSDVEIADHRVIFASFLSATHLSGGLMLCKDLPAELWFLQ